jgi:hypothetical protein
LDRLQFHFEVASPLGQRSADRLPLGEELFAFFSTKKFFFIFNFQAKLTFPLGFSAMTKLMEVVSSLDSHPALHFLRNLLSKQMSISSDDTDTHTHTHTQV